MDFKISEDKAPLLPGIFAQVSIHGKTLHDALAIPRNSIHEGNKLWVINDDILHIKTLDIVRQDRDFVYIISESDSRLDVITSSLDTVIDGMKVRTEADIAAKQSIKDIDQLSKTEE